MKTICELQRIHHQENFTEEDVVDERETLSPSESITRNLQRILKDVPVSIFSTREVLR